MVTSRKKVSLVMVLVMVLLDILHSLEHIPLKVILLKVIHPKGIPHRATLPLGTLPVHTHHLVILLAHLLPTNQDIVVGALGACLLGGLLLLQPLMVPMRFKVEAVVVTAEAMVVTAEAVTAGAMVVTEGAMVVTAGAMVVTEGAMVVTAGAMVVVMENSSTAASTAVESSSVGSLGRSTEEGNLRSGSDHPACQLDLVLIGYALADSGFFE